MILTQLTKPDVEPVSIKEVLAQIRADLDTIADPIELLEGLIEATRERAEAITKRALITQTWRLTLDSFSSNRIDIPKPPLQTIDAIKYIDLAGIEQTINPSLYRVVAEGDTGYVTPVYGKTWPDTLSDTAVVKIEFTCGYGPLLATPDTTNVPKSLKQWILINVANLFENRESIVIGNIRESVLDLNATMADGLIENYRILRV